MDRRNLFIDGVNLNETNSLKHLLENSEHDEDEEVNLIQHSLYYDVQEFVNMINANNGLSILDLNIQSINAKYDDFKIFMERVNIMNPVSVVCLNECWIKENDNISNFNLNNYNMVFQCRQRDTSSTNGGLLIYVHEQFKCTNIIIDQISSNWEYLCVEICHFKPHSKKHVICNVYRKPGGNVPDIELFIDEFSTLLKKIQYRKHSAFICGDFNIDILKLNVNIHISNYFNSIISCGFIPLITLPSRLSDHSHTLIDNILTNNVEPKHISGVLSNQLSDHQIFFSYL